MRYKNLLAWSLSVLFCVMSVTLVQAMTYYVAPTGSDSNEGTSRDAPFLTIQKCINSMGVAGDVCSVADGTYSVPTTTHVVGNIGRTAASGTPANPSILKSMNHLGAHIVLPGGSVDTVGFYVSRSSWIIEGFDISGGTSQSGNIGITVDGAIGTIIRNNSIHHIGRTVCSMDATGFAGVYTTSNAGSTIIEDNKIYSIGRMRSGEGSCGNSLKHHDHGLYIEATPTITIRRNVFWDTNRGWPIHVYTSRGGTTRNLSIYNNTFSGQAPENAPLRPQGHIILASTVVNATIRNNISHDGYLGFMYCVGGAFTNVLVEHNLSDSAIRINCSDSVTFSSNLTSMDPGFVDAGSKDFRLKPGSSPAIDSGVAISDMTYNGTAPDLGAYESGTITPPPPPRNLRVQ
jgi:hypothetical protein